MKYLSPMSFGSVSFLKRNHVDSTSHGVWKKAQLDVLAVNKHEPQIWSWELMQK